MNSTLMIVVAIAFYTLLVLLWKAREKLKDINEYKGVIGVCYSAILGIVGASIYMLQQKLFVGLHFT